MKSKVYHTGKLQKKTKIVGEHKWSCWNKKQNGNASGHL